MYDLGSGWTVHMYITQTYDIVHVKASAGLTTACKEEKENVDSRKVKSKFYGTVCNSCIGKVKITQLCWISYVLLSCKRFMCWWQALLNAVRFTSFWPLPAHPRIWRMNWFLFKNNHQYVDEAENIFCPVYTKTTSTYTILWWLQSC
jgi:hypothetical protein